MSFTVIIPARLASTRLPNKPLADLAGKPMIVRVAEQAALSGAMRVIVATDHATIADACREHGVEACMTRIEHLSGTDRIAEVALKLGLPADAVVVNVQGDEPRIAPELIAATAALVTPNVPMATAAHGIERAEDLFNPNIVKVVLDCNGRALYFSRAPIPWHRDAIATSATMLPSVMPDLAPAISGLALRHVGLYAFRHDFLQAYSLLAPSPQEQCEALEQLRALWHGHAIAVYVADAASEAGVDTPEDLSRVRRAFAVGAC